MVNFADIPNFPENLETCCAIPELISDPSSLNHNSYWVCSGCHKRLHLVEPEVENAGGPNTKYDVPEGAKILQDLIEHKEMNFAVANIFKAAYRLGGEQDPDVIRDLDKIIFFAQREKARHEK